MIEDPRKERRVAFLRAINVGGRRVKMDRLREVFEAMGFEGVETFIASGNVVFDTSKEEPCDLEQGIEAGLQKALGYEVDTFARSVEELVEISARAPFGADEPREGSTLSVAFLKEPLDREGLSRLVTHETETDLFGASGREVYWLCHSRTSDSKFSNAVLEKEIGAPATTRNIITIRRMAAKFASWAVGHQLQ